MSYPHQAPEFRPAAVPARRPASVTLAAVVLALMTLGAVAYAVTALLALGGTVDRFRAAAGTGADADDISAMVTLLRVGTIVSAMVTVLVGLVLVGLAVGLLAGRRGAQLSTWVVSGLGLLGGCCTLAALVGQRAAPLEVGDPGLLPLLGEAYPAWWLPVNAGLSVAQLLGYLVVAVLLALPAAHRWFGAHRPAQPAAPPQNPYHLRPPQGARPPEWKESR
ncbi:hypothetical protein [Micromonospora sp. KC213]|uniref:hypothetical protein n=1 Tax=Micromonospora sp. KC213 TaxID=2530378 RepID=UPI001FB66DEB|nr:hypothetical protein [Micromonospora sp. KC213]